MLYIDRVEDNAFSLHDLYGHTQVQEPCPGIHEIYNYGRNILGHHFYILSLSAPFLGVEEKILIEILHFHLMTYVAPPQHQTPAPRVRKLIILVDSSWVIITIYLNVWSMPGFLKKYINFTHYLKLPPLGVRVMKFTISWLLSLQMLHTKFGKDWLSNSWEKNVNGRRTTEDGWRRTPTHSNRSPEWLRWPKKNY